MMGGDGARCMHQAVAGEISLMPTAEFAKSMILLLGVAIILANLLRISASGRVDRSQTDLGSTSAIVLLTKQHH